MQIDGARWSVITGIVDKNIVLCVRNVGYVEHAGEVARIAFGKLGSAGGHRSAAKAVMPLSQFKQRCKISHRSEIGNKIVDLFLKAKSA
jgi:nanoRNase/pAp phosphatase (c-di-AMP/oligoRNAs hydrolase)